MRYLNDINEFYNKAEEIAEVFLNPRGSYSIQVWGERKDNGYAPSSCDNPITGEPLSEKESYKLIANALRTYSINKWKLRLGKKL